jgi:type I pantothenate kinase
MTLAIGSLAVRGLRMDTSGGLEAIENANRNAYSLYALPCVLLSGFVEGLNVLQAGDVGAFVSDYFDFSIFVDADPADIEDWYIERFLTLKETAFTQPDAYFRRYAELTNGEAIEVAREIWGTINLVNLVENILPTRARASLILEKASDHSVKRVRLRR